MQGKQPPLLTQHASERTVLAQLAGVFVDAGQDSGQTFKIAVEHLLPTKQIVSGYPVRSVNLFPPSNVVLSQLHDAFRIEHELTEYDAMQPQRTFLFIRQPCLCETLQVHSPHATVLSEPCVR